MRIVISFGQMVGFGGTETYVLTVASALTRLGHDVVIYTAEAGPCADFARECGMRLIVREHELPSSCDAVLAQDAPTAYTMACRYPDAVRVYVAHSTAYALQNPPQAEGVCHRIVVLNERLRRRSEQLAGHPQVVRLRQPIDLQRFCFRAVNLVHRRPPRLLWLSNYGDTARLRMLEEACRAVGMELSQTGRVGAPTATPEHDIADAEIVVSLGRGVLEAMASGRAAYVFGVSGVDGWVTADTYPALEEDGFSGRALGKAISVEQLAADLSDWRPDMGEAGRDLVCAHHDADQHAVELLEMIEQAGAAGGEPPSVAGEMARLVRVEWERTLQVREASAEAGRLRDECAVLHQLVTAGCSETERADARIAGLEIEVAALRATRRWRAACLLCAPIDRLRECRARWASRT